MAPPLESHFGLFPVSCSSLRWASEIPASSHNISRSDQPESALKLHHSRGCYLLLPGCGGTIHADVGSIKSPNYPQNFPANVECSWQIIAHEGSHLEMTFNDEFQIPDSSGVCLNSYVKVGRDRASLETRSRVTIRLFVG